jgi:carbonic anhydrase
VLECMDGRPQRKVAEYLSAFFGVSHIDTITTAGTVHHLAADTEQTAILLANLAISMNGHGSRRIAVVAHHDCAGNPVADETQREEVVTAVGRLSHLYPNAQVIGLWLDEQWNVVQVAGG